jgi:RNA polymerase sigma-70 factor (ECF subfamily)
MASVKESPSHSRHDDVDLERDRVLVERCQAGDQRAFEDLYLRYRDRLYRFCLRRTGNPAEAEDLVQETFARAWKALPRLDGERRFYPWLSVIANNLCTDLARRGGRCTPVEDNDLDLIAPAEAPEQERLIDTSGDWQMLSAALGRLSPRHREVLELREGRNWSYQQIAAHSGVEVSTIETLLFRARRSLKREFLTIARAETGLAGILAFPFVGLRNLFRKARKTAAHSPVGAKLTGLASGAPAATIVGGAAVVITVAALTAGALTGTHLSSTTTAARTPAALSTAAGSTVAPGSGLGIAASPRLHQSGSATGTRTSRHHHRSRTDGRTSAKSGGSGGGIASPALGGVGALGGFGSGIAGLGSTVQSGLGSATNTVKKTVKGVTGTVKGVGSGVSGTVSSVTGGASSGLSGVSGAVSSISGGLP